MRGIIMSLNGNTAIVNIDGIQQQATLASNVKPEYLKLGVEGDITIKDGFLSYFKAGQAQDKQWRKPEPQKQQYQNFNSQGKTEFWGKKHVVKSGLSDMELETLLNELGNTNGESFTYATQTHFVDGKWNAVVFIREKPTPDY